MSAPYVHAVMLLSSLSRLHLPARPGHVIRNTTRQMARMVFRLINDAKPRLNERVTTAEIL
jgi:hypothetical protein